MLPSKRILHAAAPIRVCDIGGWTDTWFARYGNVLNIAVYPYVEVQLRIEQAQKSEERVIIDVENYGDVYSVNPEDIRFGKHPLIEAAIEEIGVPEECALRINIYSIAPPGASTGTSAAVSVALIGALDGLAQGRLTPHEIAMLAHSIETKRLGLQSGVQDQLCSAHGGISYIEVHEFPHASVSSIFVPDPIWWEFEERIAVVYAGRPHSSSELHKKVIEDLGPDASRDERIVELRRLAGEANSALYAGDFEWFGQTMNRNTDVQRSLHKELVGEKFEEIIELCKYYNALGCKVNGAGGDGGSLTVLTNGDAAEKRRLLKELTDRSYPSLHTYLSRRGLRVW